MTRDCRWYMDSSASPVLPLSGKPARSTVGVVAVTAWHDRSL
jgi:hypothetical protein